MYLWCPLYMNIVVGLKRRDRNVISREGNIALDDGNMFSSRVGGRGSSGNFNQNFYSDNINLS